MKDIAERCRQQVCAPEEAFEAIRKCEESRPRLQCVAEWNALVLGRADHRSPMAESGPPLWRALHAFASTWRGGATEAMDYLAGFVEAIPCGACRAHWQTLNAASPPELRTPEVFFAWTVARHNDVNRTLGKREVSLAEAKLLFPTQTQTQTDP